MPPPQRPTQFHTKPMVLSSGRLPLKKPSDGAGERPISRTKHRTAKTPTATAIAAAAATADGSNRGAGRRSRGHRSGFPRRERQAAPPIADLRPVWLPATGASFFTVGAVGLLLDQMPGEDAYQAQAAPLHGAWCSSLRWPLPPIVRLPVQRGA